MDELGLPSRLFETGFELRGKKRVNNYFNLRWIEVLRNALDDDDLTVLDASQFGRVLQMGSHTFSVMFLHYVLSRQLVTEKDFELWWLFVGKPIWDRKGKSSSSSPSIWDVLFRGEEKPTTSWILDRLAKGKKYKDPLTHLRLALLLLVEGILCPTCGITNIRPEVVRLLDNMDEFLEYPWGQLGPISSQFRRSWGGFISLKKGHPVPADSSEGNNTCQVDKEHEHQRVGDSEVHSREARGQQFKSRDDAPTGGRSTCPGVANLVRLAAEAYEEHLLPMFEGYMVSIKDHIFSEFRSLQTEVDSANSFISKLDSFVRLEFSALRNASTFPHMYGGDTHGGYSPRMPLSPTGASFPDRSHGAVHCCYG
ncbi:DUF1985 domain-containing protein [Raphanus sativus]|nr:DUF1985 domain-containing protein [Raphanus sativus]